MDWLSGVAGILGGLGDIWASNSANSFQRENLERQMEFNREVMQNKHQWEMQDLRQAGLNPLMSVTSPTGTLSAPSAPAASKAQVSGIANTAIAMKQLSIADKQAEAQLLSSQAAAKNADTAYQGMINTGRDIDSLIRSRQFQNDTTWQMVQAQMDSARTQAELYKAQTAKTWLENSWIPKLSQANLNEIQTRIANSISETAAKIVLMDRQGQAALTNAAAYQMFVNTMEQNGISMRNLNAAQIDKLNADIDKVAKEMDISERGMKIKEALAQPNMDIASFKHELFTGDNDSSAIGGSAYRFGSVVSDIVGLNSLFNFAK